MTTEQNLNVKQSNASDQKTSRIILGFVFLAPALICCISELAVPTVRTFITSLQKVGPLGREATFVGLENYSRMFQDEVFSTALGFTLSLLLVRLLVVAIAPVLLALIVNQFGRRVRVPIRLLFTIPIVLFAPVVIAVTWMMALNPTFGFFPGTPLLADPERVRPTLLLIDSLYTLGLASGIGLIVYLAALRYEDDDVPPLPKALLPIGACWLIGLLATMALSLQTFSFTHVLTGGGPMSASMTLGLYQYRLSFMMMRFGIGATIASLTLLVSTGLGLIAGLIVVFIGLRLKAVPEEKGVILLSGLKKPVAIILLVLILLVSLSIGSLSVLPLLWNNLNSFKTTAELFQVPASFFPSSPTLEAYQELNRALPRARMVVNSILPVAGTLFLVQLPVAYLAALGIGALRPLGQRSEFLLLLFSPWLFVTVAPLSIIEFQGRIAAGTLNTLMGLTPPILISVPILFILTLFFKGQAAKWEAAQAEGQSAVSALFNRLVVPSLPLVILLAGVALFIGLQDLLWPLLVANNAQIFTLMLTLLRLQFEFGPAVSMVAAAVTLFWMPISIFFFLVFVVFQIFYLDRLSLSK